ncbi:MAG: Ig-like domain-containing protein, partial [Propionibacteriaceae bacterium]|nr:Ig-like domain-containing protein [Propionibacteriaceae bacterium]
MKPQDKRTTSKTSSWKRALAGIASGALVVGGLSLTPLISEVAQAAATTGTIYDTGGWHSGVPLDVYLAAGSSGAAATTKAPFTPLDDKTLYGSSYNNGGTVYTFARNDETPNPAGQVLIGYGHNVSSLQSNPLSTIAVDADPDGVRGVKYAYLWGWNSNNGVSNSEATSLGMTNWSGLPNDYAPIFRIKENESDFDVLMVPTPDFFPDSKSAYQYWSGGEVIQGTGEIFFGGGECTRLDAGYRMMILNPVTGAYNYSNQIVPATPQDDIFAGTGTSCGGQGYVASDFALDANGNAYLSVNSSQASATFGVAATSRVWLVRVVPSTTGNWTYNLVTPLVLGPNQSTQANNYATGGTYNYGSAFFGGKQYVTVNQGDNLLEINPMSAQIFNLPHGPSNPPSMGPVQSYVQDLASGQTAIVIQGSVYNDTAGDGSVAGDAAIPGQVVAVYSKNASGDYVYEGKRTTGPSGDYSFLVSSYGDYLVRLVTPTLDSRNAVQTWASAGGVHNPVTAKCDSGDLSTSGPCSGALSSPYPVDPALPTANTAAGSDTSTQPSAMAVYSTVHITTSTEVINADFAITTAGDYGDSPLGPATVAAGAPFHLNSIDPQLWLGGSLGVSAGPVTDDSDASDDGVSTSTFFGDQLLGTTVLAATHEYTLKAAVSGPKAAQAQITGWTAPAGSWVATPAWTPTLSGTTASGPFRYQTSGTVAATGHVRVDASLVADAAPSNPAGSYTVYPGTAYWAVPGEIEDYTVNLAEAVYHPAAVTTGPTGTFTVDSQVLTADDDPVVVGTATATTAGAKPFTATVPDASWTVERVEVRALETGAVLSTEPVSQAGLNFTFSHTFTAGDDVVLVVVFKQGANPSQSSLTVDKNTTEVGTNITATATIRDSNGGALNGVEVTFSTAHAAVTLGSNTCTTGPAGTCTVTVSSHVAGVYTNELSATVEVASVATEISNSPQSLTFTPGPINPGTSTLSANPLTQTSGSPITATVTVKDEWDNVWTGLTATDIVLSAVSGTAGVPDSSLEITNFTEVGNGVYTYTVTSKLVGSFTLSATVQTVPLNQHPVVTFTAGGVCVSNCTPVDPTHITRVVMTLNDQLADGTATDTARAYAYDQYGNAVESARVIVTDKSTGALAGKITPTTSTVTTGPDGTVDLSWTSATAGSFTAESTIDDLKPSVGGVLSGDSGIRFTNGSADPAKSTLVVTPAGPIVAGESYTAVVTILDSTDNAVADEVVSFTTNSPDAAVSAPTCTTNSSGQCQVTFTSKLAGTYELSAKVPVAGTQTNISGSPASREFIAGEVCVTNCTPVNPANVTRVVVTKNGAEANGTDTDEATVYAYDRFGNAVANAAVLTTTTDSTLDIVTPTATTLGNGTAILSYTSSTAGTKPASVTVDTKTPQGSPVSLTFGAGVGDPGHSTLSISPTVPQVVESFFTLTAHVADATDNAVEGTLVTFSTDALATLNPTTCTTGPSGDCTVTVTSLKVGTYAIHATIPDLGGTPTEILNSPVSATFTAGEVCTKADGCTPDTGEPATRVEILTNGVANDGIEHDIVRVFAYDKHGNAVPGASVVSTPAAGVTELIVQTSITPTGPDGTTTIWYASLTAGAYPADVRVDNKTPQGSPVTLAFGSGLGEPANSTFVVSPNGPITVGEGAANTYTATATVHDVFDAPAAGVVVTFDITPSAGPEWAGGVASCSTGPTGTCSALVHSTKSGTYTITASLTNGAIRTGTSTVLNPVYGVSVAWKADDVCSAAEGCTPVDPTTPPELRTRIEVTLDNQLADGNAYDEVTVYAFDQWGNAVPQALVTSSPTESTLHVQTGIPGTDDHGESIIKYSSTVAGPHTATVQVDSKAVPGSPATLTFVPGSPSLTQSALSVVPTTLIVGETATVTAVIKDAGGNVIPGVLVTFSVTGDAELSALSDTTDGNGLAHVTLSDKTAETVNVTATIKIANTDRDISGSPAPVTFLPGPVCMEPGCTPDPGVDNDHRTRVEVTVDNQTANGTSADKATAWAFDQFGNAVPNVAVTTDTTAAQLTVGTPSAVTLANGSAVLNYTSNVAGGYQAHVYLDGAEIIFTPQPGSSLDTPEGAASKSSPVTLTFIPGAIDLANSTLVVSPTTLVVGNSASVTVTVRDAGGNAIPG